MPTWSIPWTDSYYRRLLLDDIAKNPQPSDAEIVKDRFIRYILEPDPLSTCVSYAPPASTNTYEQNGKEGNAENKLSSSSNITASILHVGSGSLTGRIGAFYGSSGICNTGIYCMPYEASLYLNTNYTRKTKRGLPTTGFYKLLQWEIVNSLETLYPFGEKHTLVIKPAGAANGGIEAIKVDINGKGDDIELTSDVCFKLYPSCLFYQTATRPSAQLTEADDDTDSSSDTSALESADETTSDSDYHKNVRNRPRESNEYHKRQAGREHGKAYNIEDGYFEPYLLLEESDPNKYISNRRYTKHRFFSTRDSQILEIKTSGRLLYARSINGIYIGSYALKNDNWEMETINNQHYEHRSGIYYMQPSPFIPAECAMLTNNTVMLYDATQAKERRYISFNEVQERSGKAEDIVQTMTFGINMNHMVLGGNKLYTMDLRSNKVDELLTKHDKVVKVTSTLWTERLYDTGSISNNSLAGSNCAFYNYWKSSKPTFWGAFTAMTVHPVHRHIMACIYGANNCIFIWDLRLPAKPILEIPLPSSEYLGARFRHLQWSMPYSDDGSSTLIAFCWRHRYPVSCKFTINRTITRFKKEVLETNWREVNTFSKGYNTAKSRQRSKDRSKKSKDRNTSVDISVDDESHPDGDSMHEGDSTASTNNGKKLIHQFHSGEVFEDDLDIRVVHTKHIPMMCLTPEEVAEKVQSEGPLIESQEDYAQMPFKVTQDRASYGIFHGYCGVCLIEKGERRICCVCTMSGSIFAMDLECQRQINCKIGKTDKAGCSKRTNAMFNYIKDPKGTLELPREFITDNVRRIRVECITPEKSPQPKIFTVGVTSEFAECQESFPLPLSSAEGTFDSKGLLQWLMTRPTKHEGIVEKRDIMSLKEFEDHIGPREHLEEIATNIWDCSSLKIDYEYDATNVNNKFLEPTPSCNCFRMNKCDDQLKVLASCLKAVKIHDDNTVTIELPEDIKAGTTSKPKEVTMEEYICRGASEGVEVDSPMNINMAGPLQYRDIVNRLLFHSPVLPKIKGDNTPNMQSDMQDEGMHKQYCGVGNLIAVKLQERQPEQTNERLKNLLDTWKTSAESAEGGVGNGIARFHKPQNQIEALRKIQTERDHLVKQLLSQTND